MLPSFSLTLLCSALPDSPCSVEQGCVREGCVAVIINRVIFNSVSLCHNSYHCTVLERMTFRIFGDTWVLLVENGFFWNCSIVTNRHFLNSSFQLILCYFSDFHCICNKTWKLLMYRETLCITDNFLALLLNFQPLHIPVLEDVSSRLIPKQLVHVLYWLEESKFVSLTCI